jgi:hypothetical protein
VILHYLFQSFNIIMEMIGYEKATSLTHPLATLAISRRLHAAAVPSPAPTSRRRWYSPVRPSEDHNVDPEVDAWLPLLRRRGEAGEERARREEEEKMAEGRKQALLWRKLLILQICLASPWVIEKMAKGWRPQISRQGLEEKITAA